MKNSEARTNEPRRRILCIDGGGIRGTFPAAFLAHLEAYLGGRKIGSYFDLIAGTSTGGIIAIALALRISASDILKFYEDHGPEIFAQNHGKINNIFGKLYQGLKHLFKPKYDPNVLQKVLHHVFKEKKIGDAQTRLLVPAWDSEAWRPYIYKTAHHTRFKSDYHAGAVDVALATSAAPSYFPTHISQHGVSLLDGGVWANNPIGIAAIEAVSILKWPANKLHILSIGCLKEVYNAPQKKGCGYKDFLTIYPIFMVGQSVSAMGIAKLITGQDHERSDAIYRVNPVVPKNVFKLDDASKIESLKGLGHSEARERQPALDSVFFQQQAEPFMPFNQLN